MTRKELIGREIKQSTNKPTLYEPLIDSIITGPNGPMSNDNE